MAYSPSTFQMFFLYMVGGDKFANQKRVVPPDNNLTSRYTTYIQSWIRKIIELLVDKRMT